MAAIATVTEKQKAFLVDTIQYYIVDPKTRRNKNPETGKCQYSGTDESEGCAIGRHLSIDLCKILDNQSLSFEYEFEYFPNNLQYLGLHFLLAVQLFHDRDNVWKDQQKFDEALQEFKNEFNIDLDEYQFKLPTTT